MAFVDSPHYAWIMAHLWGMKNFLVSLGSAELFRPSLVPTLRTLYEAENNIDHWQAVFNGLSGPYLLLSLTFENLIPGPASFWWGNYVQITCDGEKVFETGSRIWDEDLTRYVGRDGEWFPFLFAKEEMLIETQPRWTGTNEPGRIRCVIMRFAE